MKLRLFSGALVLAAAATAVPHAKAQVGIYLNPVVSRVSNSGTDGGSFSFLGADTTSRWFGGVAIGGYDDFYKPANHRFVAGVDIRDTIEHANNASFNSFLVGARIVSTRDERFRPYAQVSVGAGRTKPEKSDIHLTRATYDVFVGADYRLGKVVDFRVVELGYGGVQAVSTGSFGNNGSPLSTSSLFHISSGLVFRFGK